MLIEGPSNLYRWSGYTSLSVKAYFNSISLTVGGHKKIQFADGSSIVYNNHDDIFGNTLMGTMHHQLVGNVTFTDEVNQIVATCHIGQDKYKPKDHFVGEIKHKGQVVSKYHGNYMGYADFDGERLFDLRRQVLAEMQPLPTDNSRRAIDQDYCLESDSRLRIDSRELKRDIDLA